jgi:hypothetical protein
LPALYSIVLVNMLLYFIHSGSLSNLAPWAAAAVVINVMTWLIAMFEEWRGAGMRW